MVKMSGPGHESDESEETVSSSEDETSDDSSDTASLKSLRFSMTPRKSKVTVKSKKSNKKVRFKAGDNLVLIYIIPNREMLGLKSESEDSDECDESDDNSDDDDDSDAGDDDDDDDDVTEDDDEDDDDGDDAGSDCKKKPKTKKPFAKLIAVKQVNRRKIPEVKNNVKPVPERTKDVHTITNPTQATQAKTKKPIRVRPRKEKKENIKISKSKEVNIDNKNKGKNKQYNKTNNAIKVDKRPKGRRNRSRLLEIRATVESSNKPDTNAVLPKVSFKSDIKPSVIDVNSSVSSKQLTNRTRLQPTSFRISKPGVRRPSSAGVSHSTSNLPEPTSSVARVVTASYSSLTSVLPDSYVNIKALQDNTVEETIKRLDPDSMNTSGKRNYAWQIANGTITSQSLRTPCILPFWDSLQNSVSEKNTIKLPT